MSRLEDLREEIERLESEERREHYREAFARQRQARAFGRNIMSAGQGWRREGLYGAVVATEYDYPSTGRKRSRPDSWRCHHYHPSDIEALQCALDEVGRLVNGGEYESCSDGSECRVAACVRDRELYERWDGERWAPRSG